MNAKWIYAVAACVATFSGSAFAAGDPVRGETFYAVCATCHGPQGEGMQAMNAPALRGREEWYIVRQLENFKNGVRGKDPADAFGQTMAPMAQVLPDKQAMEDVAAYLKSLGK
jgi:cytochrome c oxidase subunit 2